MSYQHASRREIWVTSAVILALTAAMAYVWAVIITLVAV